MYYNGYITDLLRDKGLLLLGFADLRETDPDLREGMDYGICAAMALEVFPTVGEVPTMAYHDEYENVSRRLREVGRDLEEAIKAEGFHAFSLNREGYDKQRFKTAHLPIKTLATRAGLGWIGKSATLITPEYGNGVRLVGVLTDMPFETAQPINTSRCGDCMECVRHCPANAIVGNNWEAGMERDLLVDPRLCKEKMNRRGELLGEEEGTCGICIAVCPHTRRYMEQR